VRREVETEILVVGGGLGGCAAAMAALRLGKKVIVTEPTDWIGGQLTAQAVPPDEHPWIEGTGCTATYRRLREGIRSYYRRNYPLLPDSRALARLNPGNGRVSPLCHEPRVGHAVLNELLAPYLSSRQAEIVLDSRPVAVDLDEARSRVRRVTMRSVLTGEELVIAAGYVLDATELGDLLPLAGVEHVVGAESQAQTGEPHALPNAPDPLDQQAITWCFAMDFLPGDHTIERPRDYDFWRRFRPDFCPEPLLGWIFVDPVTLELRDQSIFEAEPGEGANDLWDFRRILFRRHYPEGRFESDITLVNWPQNDYFLGPIIGVSDDEQRRHLEAARQLSLSFLYWMQTEAPRRDRSGHGYPGLRLRGDVVGTDDGLAKHVYVRESRRIVAEFTVLEQHVGVEARHPVQGAEVFPDSCGIGSYRIDLHPSTRQRTYVDISSWPFQLPLGALIPVRMENLLPACKNIGVTHITNGCYRLHPVEWNVGEAAGALAAFCLSRGLTPRQVRNTDAHLADFQQTLVSILGIELAWPNPRATAR
jgi:hypothetical protein